MARDAAGKRVFFLIIMIPPFFPLYQSIRFYGRMTYEQRKG